MQEKEEYNIDGLVDQETKDDFPIPLQQAFPSPKIGLEVFLQKYEKVNEVLKAAEWEDVYSNYYHFDKYQLDVDINEPFEEIEQYDAARQVQEIIKCANSFAYFCHKYIKIRHPLRGLIPFIIFKYQKRAIQNYSNNRFNILSKFRQGGLTTVTVLWSLWRCLFMTDQQILVVSKTDREAIGAGEIVATALEHLPKWMIPNMGKCNDHEKEFKDTGSKISFYTTEAARSKAITLLVIDEAAFIPDMHKHWKGLYPVVATGGSVCVISTVNGMGNWYEETYHDAETKHNNFNIIEMDYWEHPDYNNPQWIEDTQANLGPKGWAQEVLRSFLGSGETYFSTNIINELDALTKNNFPIRISFPKFANQEKNEKNDWEPGALWIWKEPIEGHEYIIAADCSEGVGEQGDNSCFQVLDQTTIEQVAEFYSNSVQPNIFAQILNEVGYYYNTAIIVVEHQNQGGAVLSRLQNDLSYENLHYDGKKQDVPGIKTGKNNRPLFIENLQNRLSNGTLRINSKRFVTELKTFIFNPRTKKPEAQRGKHDDAVMSMAMAIYIRDTRIRDMPIGTEAPEEIKELFNSEIYKEIRREIMSDSFDANWTETEEFNDNDDEELGLAFLARRKNNAILKDFGW